MPNRIHDGFILFFVKWWQYAGVQRSNPSSMEPFPLEIKEAFLVTPLLFHQKSGHPMHPDSHAPLLEAQVWWPCCIWGMSKGMRGSVISYKAPIKFDVPSEMEQLQGFPLLCTWGVCPHGL